MLRDEFDAVEAQVLHGQDPTIAPELVPHFDAIFESATQAYREVLLGCVLARLLNPAIDIHKPYVNQGEDAYNGRTLDERVVNPFLRQRRIPSSTGPFLSTFRRSVMFAPGTRVGVRDREGFDRLLTLIDHLAQAENNEGREFLRYLLYRFIRLREAAEVPVSRLHRISLEQYGSLIDGLLSVPSGGRFALMLAETTFLAIRETLGLNWTIDVQGINVADRAAGAGGDITITQDGGILLAVEVTERPVDQTRVTTTFQTKIAPTGIQDYMFLVGDGVDEEAVRQARQYFAQGHEVTFQEIKNWILTVLATLGRRGREAFNRILIAKLESDDTPAALRVAWNEQLARITAA